MRAFLLPLSPRAPILNKLQTIRRRNFRPKHTQDLYKPLQPTNDIKDGHRNAHTTSPFAQSRAASASSRPPKPSPSAAPKPLSYKPTNTLESPKPRPSNTRHTDAKPIDRSVPKTEQSTLNSVRAWNSFVTNVSSGRGDSEAGRKAAAEVVRTGRLPEKYKPASKKITSVIVALPIFIVCGYELYQRVVRGKERKDAHSLPQLSAEQASQASQSRSSAGVDQGT